MKLGVRKGDVFAIYSVNTPELVIMVWAVIATGAVMTSVNPTHTARNAWLTSKYLKYFNSPIASKLQLVTCELTVNYILYLKITSSGYLTGYLTGIRITILDRSLF